MEELNELVSVVVPVYNVEKYIGECVSSILKQTYKNLEVIIVLDGSQDGSVGICRKLQETDKRIRIIEKENGGVSSARNIGIQRAQGDYLMFVDGDDWLESNAVETLLLATKKYKVDACFSNCYYRNEDAVVRATKVERIDRIDANELIEKHLKFQFLASPWLTLVRLTKVKQCLFDESIHTLEDWEYNFRMLTCIRAATIIDSPFYHYREVQGSASKSKLNAKKMTCFRIPERIQSYVKMKALPYQELTEYSWIFLLNHMLVLLANNEYAPEEAEQLKKIARQKLRYACTADIVPLKQKVYILMCAISPKVFCAVYHIKYWRRK